MACCLPNDVWNTAQKVTAISQCLFRRIDYSKPTIVTEICKMRRFFLYVCMLLFMLILIGTAYADWFMTATTAAPIFLSTSLWSGWVPL